MDSPLFGPDVSEEPAQVIEEVGDPIQIWCRQFVNRWVLLAHQRPTALAELNELIAEARK